MRMSEEIMAVSTELHKLSLKVLKGSSNLKGIQLLLICEWLELLFVTYAITENPQLPSLKINIHADENVFAGRELLRTLVQIIQLGKNLILTGFLLIHCVLKT